MKILRKIVIGLGYVSLASIIVGIYVLFINRYNPLFKFDEITQRSGIGLLCVGFGVLVLSALAVKYWLKKEDTVGTEEET